MTTPRQGTIARFIALRGWRKRGLLFLLGGFMASAMAPVFFWPSLYVSIPLALLATVHAPNRKKAFGTGWWFGLGYFVFGLYWICLSLWVEPEKFAWFTPLALFGLPSVLAIYSGLAGMLAYQLTTRPSPEQDAESPPPSGYRSITLYSCLLFAFCWTGMEYLRGQLFTGFPWNLVGYSWAVSDATLQPAALFGIHGMGVLTVLFAAIPALLFGQKAWSRPRRHLTLLIAFSLPLAFWIFGQWRLEQEQQLVDTHAPQPVIHLVQPNIDQATKWNRESLESIIQRLIRLSSPPPGSDTIFDIIIWPESAMPLTLSPESKWLQDVLPVIPENGTLITGAIRTEGFPMPKHVWNSVFVIEPNGHFSAIYDKHHLVPFGEYVPLAEYLPLEQIAGGSGPLGFSRGVGPKTLQLPEPLPKVGPLICYEAIFHGKTVNPNHRPGWLANLTNDAWFGISSGPHQHLHMARTRSVEKGLPMIRVANTGISAIIDAFGRIKKRTILGKESTLTGKLPQPLTNDPTLSLSLNKLFILLAGIFSYTIISCRKIKHFL